MLLLQIWQHLKVIAFVVRSLLHLQRDWDSHWMIIILKRSLMILLLQLLLLIHRPKHINMKIYFHFQLLWLVARHIHMHIHLRRLHQVICG